MPYIIQVDTQDRLLEILKIVVPAVIGITGVLFGIFVKEGLDKRAQRRKTQILRSMILREFTRIQHHLFSSMTAEPNKNDEHDPLTSIIGLYGLADELTYSTYVDRLGELREVEALKVQETYLLIQDAKGRMQAALDLIKTSAAKEIHEERTKELYGDIAQQLMDPMLDLTHVSIGLLRYYYKPLYRRIFTRKPRTRMKAKRSFKPIESDEEEGINDE